MSELARIIAKAEHLSGAKHLTPGSAIDQDMRIIGDDVSEFAAWLADEYGDHVWQWPWQRLAELSEPSIFTAPYFLWALLTWPFRGRLFDPSAFERLELGHIAAVIERGEWFEP